MNLLQKAKVAANELWARTLRLAKRCWRAGFAIVASLVTFAIPAIFFARAGVKERGEWFGPDGAIAWLTAILAVATVVLAVYTALLFREASESSRRTSEMQAKLLDRKHQAAKAGVLMLISEQSAYAEAAFKWLVANRTQAPQVTLPTLSQRHIRELQDAIEAVDDDAFRDRLVKLVGSLQLVRVRLENYKRPMTKSYENSTFVEYCADVAAIKALTNSLFEYCRAQIGSLPEFTHKDWREGLGNLVDFKRENPLYEAALGFITRNEERGDPPYIYL